MVLLHLLAQLAVPHKWRLAVAHFNHQMRGSSSAADERLVRRTAEKLGFKFAGDSGNVRNFARENKLSLEMAARKLRHEFLARAAHQLGMRRIALAHHADDQLELFFVRLLRGAGGEGMAGMKWLAASPVDSRLKLARPLLDQPKSSLAAYAKAERVSFREDASNADLDIQRNRIRHETASLAQRENSNQPWHGWVLRQMEIVGAEAEFVTDAARAWLEKKHPEFETLPTAVLNAVVCNCNWLMPGSRRVLNLSNIFVNRRIAPLPCASARPFRAIWQAA